jgi:hypothetical protein
MACWAGRAKHRLGSSSHGMRCRGVHGNGRHGWSRPVGPRLGVRGLSGRGTAGPALERTGRPSLVLGCQDAACGASRAGERLGTAVTGRVCLVSACTGRSAWSGLAAER